MHPRPAIRAVLFASSLSFVVGIPVAYAAAPAPSSSTSSGGTCGHLATPDGKPTFKLVTSKSTKPAVTTSYPAFTFDCDGASKVVNAAIEREVKSRVKAYRDSYATDGKTSGGDTWTEDVGCNPALVSPSIVSIFCGEGQFTGGAHPGSGSFSFAYAISGVDGGSAKPIALDDLLMPGKRAELAKRATKSINDQKKKNGIDNPTDADTVGPAMLTFVLGDTSLKLEFDAYIVGSYTEGPYEVELPYASLKGLLRTDGPASKLV